MGFVTEYLNDNAHEFLKRYGLPCWAYGQWTFDREREIYLTHVKTTVQDEIWHEFCLIYKGEKVSIEVQTHNSYTKIKDKEIGTTIMFINSIVAPKRLKPYRDEIVAAIREAFTQMHSVSLHGGNPPRPSKFGFIIENMAEPRFGFRELHLGMIMLLEIIDGEKSVIIFSWGKCGFSQFDLSNLLADAERQCRDNHTEFIDFFTKGKDHEWGILTPDIIEKYGEETPDWCWNRETKKLYRPEER